MKLDPDCIRDILIAVESETTAAHVANYPSETFDDLDKKYGEDVVYYHVIQCLAYGYFREAEDFDHLGIRIPDLSPVGHEFLANVRKDTIWNDVKSVAGKVGASSMSALTQIASNVISEIIKAQLGLSH